MDFHHVDPSTKSFCITRLEINVLAWDKLIDEVRKCALLCCRCHREYEVGLISDDIMRPLYERRWQEINARLV